mgnify:CR=1 FL=1
MVIVPMLFPATFRRCFDLVRARTFRHARVVGLGIVLLAAGLTGANWSYAASSLGDDAGGPPRLGQTFIAIDPVAMGRRVMSPAMKRGVRPFCANRRVPRARTGG